MNRRELCQRSAETLGLPAAEVERVLAAVLAEVTTQLAQGEPVNLAGFAKFARVDRAERQGRNPQTGEAITIAASRKVRITPLKGLKDAVL